jgi:hypothetical protein
MPIAVLIRQRAVRPRERMNSPLESRKVRLRGLGGRAVCGGSNTCASATREHAVYPQEHCPRSQAERFY